MRAAGIPDRQKYGDPFTADEVRKILIAHYMRLGRSEERRIQQMQSEHDAVVKKARVARLTEKSRRKRLKLDEEPTEEESGPPSSPPPAEYEILL